MTEKKVKRHLKRIWYHLEHLQDALSAAHNADVIEYKGDYSAEAPCWAMDQVRDRVRKTTEKACRQAIEHSVRNL